MVELLTKMIFRLSGGLALALLATSWAAAEGLPDPTRPPSGLAGSAAGGMAEEEKGPVLQSVLISSGRKSAIIGGQVVSLGEKFGEARVVKITESEVVLQTGTTREVLRLFPEVNKRQAGTIRQRQSSRGKPEGGGAK